MVRALSQIELPSPSTPAGEVRRIAEEVLARPEFAPPSLSPLARLRVWLAEQLGRLLELLLGTGGGSVLGTVVLVLVTLVVVVLALRFARGVRREPVRKPSVTVEELGRSPAEWDEEATAHERAGRRRDAVRCRYRGLVAALVADGLVDEVPGRTSGEYRALVGDALPEGAATFAEATELFETVWYGDSPVRDGDLEALHGQVGRVRAAAEGRRRSPVGAGR